MGKQIIIKNLTTSEKVQLMEELWNDLSSSSNYSPPEWHEKELARRKNAVAEGKSSYMDWEIAKQEIREDLK